METEIDTDLFEAVRNAYLEVLPTFPIGKQFHFLSRAYLWTKKGSYREKLELIRDEWWKRFEKRLNVVLSLSENPGAYVPKKKGKAYRQAYKAQYAELWAYNSLFFMCLFDETVFGGNAFVLCRSKIDLSHLKTLHSKLFADEEAVHILSTPALNFLTLSSHFFSEELSPVTPEYILRVGGNDSGLSGSDAVDANLYFYSHAIIGATRFYAKEIPKESLGEYRKMLQRMERILEDAYDTASLDHKCEFLVCADMCGYSTDLKGRIHKELGRSIKVEGTYFINTENEHRPESHTPTMSKMEHTNILALMAFLEKEGL